MPLPCSRCSTGWMRQGVVAGDQRMIDRWWELLDIGYPKN
jgi:hypothetical protein